MTNVGLRDTGVDFRGGLHSHHLLKRTETGWNCQVCQWQWRFQPKTWCPGVPRYSCKSKPAKLMTKSELEKAGFKLAGTQPIRGCVYSSDEKNSYWLYKITEAVPKKKLK